MLTFINSSRRILFDKSYDFLSYYYQWKTVEDNENNLDSDKKNDKIENYSDHIQLSLYNSEDECHRLFSLSSYYDEYTTFFSEPTHIVDNIYIGSAYNACDYQTMQNNNIKMVINVTTELSNYFDGCDGLVYLNYPLYDNNKESIRDYLSSAYSQIINYQKVGKGNILIHCFMGASRSASVIIYYLMKKDKDGVSKYSFDEALSLIKSRRKIVNPTFRLTKDLIQAVHID